jgi:hypothetical protein
MQAGTRAITPGAAEFEEMKVRALLTFLPLVLRPIKGPGGVPRPHRHEV